MFNPEIFRAYDIRGVYEKDFDEGFAFLLGRALVKYLDVRNFLIAQDSREASAKISHAVIKGITSIGGNASYLSFVTLPFFNYVFNTRGMEGGIMVTASHNGPEYAGFKIFSSAKGIISSESGLTDIRDMIQRDSQLPENDLHRSARSLTVGGLSKYGGQSKILDIDPLLNDYTIFIFKQSELKKEEIKDIKIKVSGPPALIREYKYLSKKINLKTVENDQDLGFTFDGDADRINVSDKAGKIIRPDYLTGLFVQDIVKFWKKPSVVYDLRFSRGVTSRFKAWKINAYRSKVGRANVRKLMGVHDADIGGELSGHIFFKDAQWNEMPLLSMLYLLRMVKRSNQQIGDLVKQFETWSSYGEISIPFNQDSEKLKNIVAALKQKFGDGQIDFLDGVTIEYPDWWFNIRPSNTEPLIRLIVEAKFKDQLEKHLNELKSIIG